LLRAPAVTQVKSRGARGFGASDEAMSSSSSSVHGETAAFATSASLPSMSFALGLQPPAADNEHIKRSTSVKSPPRRTNGGRLLCFSSSGPTLINQLILEHLLPTSPCLPAFTTTLLIRTIALGVRKPEPKLTQIWRISGRVHDALRRTVAPQPLVRFQHRGAAHAAEMSGPWARRRSTRWAHPRGRREAGGKRRKEERVSEIRSGVREQRVWGRF